MGLFKTIWNFVKKPIELAGNVLGGVIGYKDLGSTITGGVDSTIQDSLQQKALNMQLEGSKYAADQAYNGQIAANNANIDIANKTNSMNRVIATETNQANKDLAEQQNKWNIEQWNRQNEYNSPAHQLELYKQAGLNPNLATGQFTPAQELNSAPLANQVPGNPMQAPHVENPAGTSSSILANGLAAASSLIKDQALNKAQTTLAEAQTANTWFNTHRGETILGAELDNLAATNEKLLAEKGRIVFLAPMEKQNLLVNNQKIQMESQWLMEQAKTEKEKRRYQKAIADAQEINTAILDKTQYDLAKMPKAELKLKLAQAFQALASGNFQDYQTKYMKDHGHTVPSDGIMLLVSYLSNDPDFVSNLKKIIGKLGKASSSAVEGADAGIKRLSKLVDKLTDIINDPVGSLAHFALTLDPFGIFTDEGIDLIGE